MMLNGRVQQLSADTAAVVSTATAGWTWLANLNDILQLIASVIAIVSGLYALRYHRRKKHQRKK